MKARRCAHEPKSSLSPARDARPPAARAGERADGVSLCRGPAAAAVQRAGAARRHGRHAAGVRGLFAVAGPVCPVAADGLARRGGRAALASALRAAPACPASRPGTGIGAGRAGRAAGAAPVCRDALSPAGTAVRAAGIRALSRQRRLLPRAGAGRVRAAGRLVLRRARGRTAVPACAGRARAALCARGRARRDHPARAAHGLDRGAAGRIADARRRARLQRHVRLCRARTQRRVRLLLLHRAPHRLFPAAQRLSAPGCGPAGRSRQPDG